MAKYWIYGMGPRRPFADYISFLRGDAHDCDTEGNSVSPTDRNWTELTIINRGNLAERVDVDPVVPNPLTLSIRSERQDLAARLAYAIAMTSGGTISDSLAGPAIAAEALIPQMGDFDLRAATERLR